MDFLTTFSVHTHKSHSKIPKTNLSTAFWSWHSQKIFKTESFRFSQFSQNFVLKKFPFYVTVGFWKIFSVDTHKPNSKIPKTKLYSILKLTFPEIFRNKSSRFSQFSQFLQNFVLKHFSFYGIVGFLTTVSVHPQKLH